MKTKIQLTLTLFIIAATCGLSAQSRETRTVNITGNFDAISVSGVHTIHYRTGPAGEPLTVIGSDEGLEKVDIYVKGKTLYVRTKDRYNNNSKPDNAVEVYVQNPSLRSASASGAGRVIISGGVSGGDKSFTASGSGRIEADRIECGKLELSLSGSARIDFPDIRSASTTAKLSGSSRIELGGASGALNASLSGSARMNAGEVASGNIDAELSGSSRMTVSGTADRLKASTSGSSRIDAANTRVKDASLSLSGASNISLECYGTLKASVTAGSKVYYTGSPANRSGSGKTENIIKR